MSWLAGLVTVASLGLLVMATGAFNSAASAPHIRVVGWALHTTMQNSVKARANPLPQKTPFTAIQVHAGAQAFARDCVGCHGAPGVGRDRWVSGLTPTPPYLIDANRRWTPGELYWIVRNGVKMTAMPAWGDQYSDAELLGLVAFLEALPSFTAHDYAVLSTGPARPGARDPSHAACAAAARAPARVQSSCVHG